jgi:glycosyltransferase involved in cell wall biosynthesis
MRSDQDVISIIVPIYNSEKTLERCVESILCQTYPYLEIILVDDGSEDGSIAICEDFCKKDARIKVVHQTNGGVSSARNNGLRHASGKYVQFVDSDDKIAPHMCEKLVERQKATEADLIICGYLLVKDNIEENIYASDTVFHGKEEWKKEFPEYLIKFLIHSPWNKLYLREKITNTFDEKYSLGEDLIFNICYLEKCQCVAGVQDILYYYIIVEMEERRNRTDTAELLHSTLKDYIDNKLDSDSVSLKTANMIYINDRLYRLGLLSREKNGLQKIRSFCKDDIFRCAVSENKKDSLKCCITYICLKYHVYIVLYLYFRMKKGVKGKWHLQ